MSQIHHISSLKELGESISNAIKSTPISKVFVLVDSNTRRYCLPLFLRSLEGGRLTINTLEFQAGEENKNLESCQKIWSELTQKGGDRNSLLLNLGGGVVTDLGGFVASTFKRGIRFYHIPTTLLGMVDASVGGKCGVDFMHYKNQIGTFSQAENIFIYPSFLNSLDEKEFLSGTAEMLKHAILSDVNFWTFLRTQNKLERKKWIANISKAIQIKSDIIKYDFEEKGIRKTLNFGHSLGHALEGFLLRKAQPTLHGFAVAAGILMEAYLSVKKLKFPLEEFKKIERFIFLHYPKITFEKSHIDEIITFLAHDKKNYADSLNFTLVEDIAKPKIDIEISMLEAKEALLYYLSAHEISL